MREGLADCGHDEKGTFQLQAKQAIIQSDIPPISVLDVKVLIINKMLGAIKTGIIIVW